MKVYSKSFKPYLSVLALIANQGFTVYLIAPSDLNALSCKQATALLI